jgi:two-component system, OmpR family, sensor histidine kinase CiaH
VINHLTDFWQSQTSRLMLTYLSIIMAMSISFSAIIYVTTVEQLERQLPRDFYVDDQGRFGPTPRVQAYIQDMISAGKQELLLRLYVLNMIMLVFGGAFSFMLARWTLEPIERNIKAQTRFVSDASHELRTPLTAIQATNEVVLRRKKLTLAEARDTIQSNLDDVKRLQRMTSMLLELLTNERNLILVPTLAQDIVSQSMTDVAPTATNRNITIDDQTGSDVVLADNETAAQALTVLLDNAIKYSPDGSTITLKTKRQRSRVAIQVIDQGPGISKQEQQKIFRRFYRSDEARTHSSGSGYGLGLEIAQNIARAHEGSIELKSTVGQGSTFSLLLQAAKK